MAAPLLPDALWDLVEPFSDSNTTIEGQKTTRS